MRVVPVLFLLFFLVPILEIYILIQVVSEVGAPLTILLVVLTALLGAWLLRLQGLSVLARMRQSLAQGELPATSLLEGVMLLVAGALLLTPGFFTDALGFFLLIPVLRRNLVREFLRSSRNRTGLRHTPPSQSDPQRTIEGEFRHEDD